MGADKQPAKVNPARTCIVYVLSDAKPHLHDQTLVAAQSRALQYQVPLAAVYTLEDWDLDVLDALRQHEVRLQHHNIPLIVLIGERQKTLAGFIHHTRPIAVYDQAIQDIGFPELETHPHRWPGVVISIEELIQLQAAGKITC